MPNYTMKWDEATIEQAYQVWSTGGNQQGPETIRVMSSLYGVTLPQQTLYKWIKRYDWDARYRNELSAAVRNPGEMHVELLQVAAIRALSYLSTVLDGTSRPDTERIRVALALESAHRSLLLKVTRKVQAPHPSAQTNRPTIIEVVQGEEERRALRERAITTQPH